MKFAISTKTNEVRYIYSLQVRELVGNDKADSNGFDGAER